MTQSDKHFERFEGHTLLKHQILRAYLSAWAAKLLHSNPRVYFVDAFAGEGKDHEGNPGSPLLAAQIAEGVAGPPATGAEHPSQRLFIYAIEILPSRCERLRACLLPFGPGHPGHVEVRQGELLDFIDEIATVTVGCPTLYFLDPFGIKGLESSTYPKALCGQQNEIFALFADVGASRLYGLVVADASHLQDRLEEVRQTPSLFPDLDQEREAIASADVTEYQRALDLSQPGSHEALTRALGGSHWEAAFEGVPASARGPVFLGLFLQELIRAGARYILTLPMRDEAGHRRYSLVHASKSVHALLAMKEAISTGLNKDVLPLDVRSKIREDLTVPAEEIIRFVQERFAGRTASWADEVKPVILKETSVFNFQTQSLRNTLEVMGYIQRGPKGKVLCQFPPLPE